MRKLVPTSNFTASFSCSAPSLFRTTLRPWWLVAVPKLQFLQSRFWCRYLASDGPDNMHSSEEQSWYFDTPSSRVAPVQLENYNGRFQDRQNHHSIAAHFELEANCTDHEMSNQQPSMPESSLTQQKAGMPRKSWCIPTTSQIHLFALQTLYFRGKLFQYVVNFAQPFFGVEIWPQMGQITCTARKNSLGILKLQLR